MGRVDSKKSTPAPKKKERNKKEDQLGLNCLPQQGKKKKLTAKTTSQEAFPNVIEGAVWWFMQQRGAESPSEKSEKQM